MKATIKLEYRKEDTVFVECKEAGIKQPFLAELLPMIIKELPDLIDKHMVKKLKSDEKL